MFTPESVGRYKTKPNLLFSPFCFCLVDFLCSALLVIVDIVVFLCSQWGSGIFCSAAFSEISDPQICCRRLIRPSIITCSWGQEAFILMVKKCYSPWWCFFAELYVLRLMWPVGFVVPQGKIVLWSPKSITDTVQCWNRLWEEAFLCVSQVSVKWLLINISEEALPHHIGLVI